ncbi:HAD family phosphatase [candidate division WOR-3 bacterium]|jgi:HAD superfamily hydrolase (TIGR01509 family)|nr:HAD family phosphatase [candidate division WOR-3 bacterium]
MRNYTDKNIKLRAVIFDMDGVVVNSQPLYFELERRYFSELGLNIPPEEYNNFVGMNMNNMWFYLKEKYHIKQSLDFLIENNIKNFVENINSSDELKPISGVVDLFNELKNNHIKIAIASSSSGSVVDSMLNKLQIKSFFDVIVCGDEVYNGKPAPDIFLLTVERLQVKPEECIVIEDSCNGVKASNSANIKCVGFLNTHSGDQDLSNAEKIIKDFSNINLEILKEIV